jgi:hypothetical protein
MSSLSSAGQGYSVDFINNSSNGGFVYMFQTNPGANVSNVQSLAWFSYGTNPATQAQFSWTVDYAMLWSTTAPLVPGVVVTASQNLPCTLQQGNQATFLENDYGFWLTSQTTSSSPGITIVEDSSLPLNTASIGISMSGAGVFAVEAQPNLVANFQPTPTYWIAFSLMPIQQGAVLITQGTPAQQITFAPNVFAMSATLNQDNSWTILPA